MQLIVHICLSVYLTELRANISVISIYLNGMGLVTYWKKMPFKNWLAKKNLTLLCASYVYETQWLRRLKINSIGKASHVYCTLRCTIPKPIKSSSNFRHCCGYWFQVGFAPDSTSPWTYAIYLTSGRRDYVVPWQWLLKATTQQSWTKPEVTKINTLEPPLNKGQWAPTDKRFCLSCLGPGWMVMGWIS